MGSAMLARGRLGGGDGARDLGLAKLVGLGQDELVRDGGTVEVLHRLVVAVLHAVP